MVWIYAFPPTRVKRGGSTQTTLDLPSESFPTSPPSSTLKHGRPIPKIDGSEGGFIGLVVGLGLLIIGCSVAVFVLLRRKSYQGSSSSSGRGLPFPLPFGKHQHDPSSGSGFPAQGSSFGRGNKGWVRTEGEDAWDDEGGVGLVNRSELRSPNPDVPQHPYPSHPDRSASVESASTVRLSAPGAGQYGDAFSTSPSTDSFHDHDEQTSRHEYAPVDTSHDLPRTPTSPTFEGGTRFKEDLP